MHTGRWTFPSRCWASSLSTFSMWFCPRWEALQARVKTTRAAYTFSTLPSTLRWVGEAAHCQGMTSLTLLAMLPFPQACCSSTSACATSPTTSLTFLDGRALFLASTRRCPRCLADDGVDDGQPSPRLTSHRAQEVTAVIDKIRAWRRKHRLPRPPQARVQRDRRPGCPFSFGSSPSTSCRSCS